MSTEKKGFRGALFGGFNRKDVLSFLEGFSKEYNEKIAVMTDELSRFSEENAVMLKEKTALSENLKIKEQELEQVNEKLSEAEQTIQTLRKQLAEVEPQAQRYEMLKDRVATVELEAHKKAEALMEKAQREAQDIYKETAVWVNEVKIKYDTIREQVRAHAVAAEKAEEEFAALGKAYEDFLNRGLAHQKDQE